VKLVFFGGTFDPPHLGHLAIINFCRKIFDQVVIIPAFQTPNKKDKPIAATYQRIKMLELLTININYNIIIEEKEINNSKVSYTIDTIDYLKKKFCNYQITMALGLDQLLDLHNWKAYEQIMKNVNIIGFNRPNIDRSPIRELKKIKFYDDLNIITSSSVIREKISNDQFPVEDLTPEVAKYITEQKLYK
tara:strand:+ start:58 stop:627 length:570 start_codon:yes stop_codon:yes gene_type:complete